MYTRIVEAYFIDMDDLTDSKAIAQGSFGTIFKSTYKKSSTAAVKRIIKNSSDVKKMSEVMLEVSPYPMSLGESRMLFPPLPRHPPYTTEPSHSLPTRATQPIPGLHPKPSGRIFFLLACAPTTLCPRTRCHGVSLPNSPNNTHPCLRYCSVNRH